MPSNDQLKADFFGKDGLNPAHCAHVAVHLQHKFLDKASGQVYKDILHHIEKDALPAFHRLGITSYMTCQIEKDPETGLFKEAPDLCITPEGDDEVLPHEYQSGFNNPDLDRHLWEKHSKTALITGVFSSACVPATAIEGVWLGYNVAAVSDCIDPVSPTVKDKFSLFSIPLVTLQEVTAQIDKFMKNFAQNAFPQARLG